MCVCVVRLILWAVCVRVKLLVCDFCVLGDKCPLLRDVYVVSGECVDVVVLVCLLSTGKEWSVRGFVC